MFYLFFDSAKVVFLNCYLNALYTCQDYRTHNPLIFDEVSIRTILLGCCDNRDGMSYLCNTIYMCTVTHQIVFTCVLLHIELYLHVYCYTSNCTYWYHCFVGRRGWSWLYGIWLYQCLSPLAWWVPIPLNENVLSSNKFVLLSLPLFKLPPSYLMVDNGFELWLGQTKG